MRKWTIVLVGIMPATLMAAPPGGPAVKLVGGVLLAFAVLVIVPLGLVAVQTLVTLWAPERMRRGSEALRARPGRCLLAGIAALGVAFCLLAIFARLPESARGIPMLLVLVTLAVVWIRGLAIVAYDVGDRLLASWQSRHVGSPAASAISGGLLLLLTTWLPIVGQLLHLVLGVLGLGAGIVGRRPREANSAPAVDSAATAE